MSFKMRQFHGSKHHIPEEVIPFLEGLEKVVGVGKINFARHIGTGSSKREIKMEYDELKKLAILKIKTSEYTQTVLLRMELSEIKLVYDFVQSYIF
jgi:hypothetical protein